MNLPLSSLRAALATGHPLTPTNVTAVELLPSGLMVTVDDSDLRDQLDDTRKERDSFEADLRQAEEERDEWERRTLTLETHAEEMRERGELGNVVFDLRADLHRSQETKRALMERLARAEHELTALRKRKGVEPGVAAYSREIYTLLGYVSQTEGRYQQEADRLFRKINS